MITAFTVKNFKAIGEEPVRIELKPITLLFGPNSSGKSSIIHALNYAYEVFNNHNLDDFKSLVHGNDLSRSIVLNFDLDFTVDIINSSTENKKEKIETNDERVKLLVNYSKLFENAKKAYIEVEISWNNNKQCPHVSRYEVGINQEQMIAISANTGSKQYVKLFSPSHDKIGSFVSYFNINHSIFIDLYKSEKIEMSSFLSDYINQQYDYLYECKEKDYLKSDVSVDNIKFYLDQKDALPNINWKGLSFVEERLFYEQEAEYDMMDERSGFYDENDIFISTKTPPEIREKRWKDLCVKRMFPSRFQDFLNIMLNEPGKIVASWLKLTCHIGPLREIPSKKLEYKPELIFQPELIRQRWVTGVAAWDILYYIGQKKLKKLEFLKDGGSSGVSFHLRRVFFEGETPGETQRVWYLPDTLDTINAWLSDKMLLSTGYKIFIEYYRDISLNSTHPLIVKLNARERIDDVDQLATEILGVPEKVRILLHDESRNINIAPHEVGTGISQVLPVVAAAVFLSDHLIAIEQPELHIHPAMQVHLGDLFINEFKTWSNRFLIETHSEYLLLRILRRIRETNEGKPKILRVPNDCGGYEEKELDIRAEEVAIYYVESENGNIQVNHIGLDENGRFIDRWPRGFFEEREKEYFGEEQDLSEEIGKLFNNDL